MPKPPPPSTSARPSRPQNSHTPLSSLSSTPCPRNPRSPSDDDLGNDDDENPFDDNNSNDDDDDDDDDEDEDADDSTQEDQTIQVFESLTHAIDSLACASRKSGSSSSQTKVCEPDTFNSTDPKKLHTFLVQCKLNFQDCPSAFKKDHAKVVFTQSYLKGMALKWFEPDLLSSRNPGSCPLWMDNWTEFAIELQSTFGPHNPVADAENQLDHLQMKDNQCINKYMVEFNQLVSQVRGYGDGTLCHQFYSGLPDCIKDKICHIGKPRNLDDLCYLAQEIDVHYWEHKEEVQHANKSSGASNFLANKPGNSAPNSSKGKPTTSSNASSSLGNANSSSSNKPKSSNSDNKLPNVAPSNPDLTGKLGKDGKLTLEERKRHLDNKLCMFCRDDGHFSNNCPKKANKGKAKAHAANAAQSPQEQSGSTLGSAPKAKK
ncbi:hypothetical protein ID866_11392 [Astraeus odoratus]|nr:hypothetical protein ID866_11392 [Astraeus odoratus]